MRLEQPPRTLSWLALLSQLHCTSRTPLPDLHLREPRQLSDCAPQGSGARVSASCALPDVQAAVAAATSGDTVIIPAGTCAWDSRLLIDKGITLAGAGAGSTVLVDQAPRQGLDEGRLVRIEVPPDETARLTGLTISAGTLGDTNWHGAITASGGRFRIDHLTVDDIDAVSIGVDGDARGVIDHCQFSTTQHRTAVLVKHRKWRGIGDYGDNSWASPSELGTENAVYLEDNVFSAVGSLSAAVQAFAGARLVVRRNRLESTNVTAEGVATGGRHRGARSCEIYDNHFISDDGGAYAAVAIEAGTCVVFGNTFEGFAGGIVLENRRGTGAYNPWGACDGTSPFDANQSGGYPCLDQVGRGMGALLAEDPPTPLLWPAQALEPLYEWNNSWLGSELRINDSAILLGRDVLSGAARPGYSALSHPHPLTACR